MRPRGIPSRWVKVLPWYYTEASEPSRQVELARALDFEVVADHDLTSDDITAMFDAGEPAEIRGPRTDR